MQNENNQPSIDMGTLIQDLMDKRIEAMMMDAMPKYMLGNEEISDGRNAYYLSCKQTAEYLLDKYKIVPLESNTSSQTLTQLGQDKKEWFFTTKDGVEKYNGDKYWWICEDGDIVEFDVNKEWIKYKDHEGFSTKEAAEEWLKNNPIKHNILPQEVKELIVELNKLVPLHINPYNLGEQGRISEIIWKLNRITEPQKEVSQEKPNSSTGDGNQNKTSNSEATILSIEEILDKHIGVIGAYAKEEYNWILAAMEEYKNQK